jgi:hypothetical protein
MSAGLPFAQADRERALAIDVPRYFIEVNVPGYSVERTVARARKRQQQLLLAQRTGSGAAD